MTQREAHDGYGRKALTVAGVAIVVAAAGAVLVLTYHFLLLLFAGILLGVLLRGLARPLHRRLRIPARLSVVLVIVALVAMGFGTTLLLQAEVATQVGELAHQLPRMLEELREQVRQSSFGRDVLEALPQLDEVVPSDGNALVKQLGGFFSSTLGVLTSVFLMLAAGLFLAFEPGVYVRGIVRLVPHARRQRAAVILEELRSVLFHWLLGRAFGMVVIGVSSWLGLSLLGVPLAHANGLLAALLTFVPNLGAVLSVIPPVLLALPQGIGTAVGVVVLYAAIQLVETYGLTPMIERIAVSLPPAMLLGAQVVFGVLGGVLGLVLAAPLAAVIMVLVRRLYVEDALHDDLQADPLPIDP